MMARAIQLPAHIHTCVEGWLPSAGVAEGSGMRSTTTEKSGVGHSGQSNNLPNRHARRLSPRETSIGHVVAC